MGTFGGIVFKTSGRKLALGFLGFFVLLLISAASDMCDREAAKEAPAKVLKSKEKRHGHRAPR